MNKKLNELQDLIQNPQENEGIELKSWVDLTDAIVRANIARHIAAIANYGGGYLIFGFNDDRTRCSALSNVRKLYSLDVISGIIHRYLIPKFQCEVNFESFEGVEHPIIWIPSHGVSPIISKADGPQDNKNQPKGIKSGQIYIRIPKPESITIIAPEQWDKLLSRCLLNRKDEMIKMFSSIVSGANETQNTLEKTSQEKLVEWHTALKKAYLEEIKAKKTQRNTNIEDNYIEFSYMLLGADEKRIPPEEIQEVIKRTNKAVKDTVRYGWSMFYPFTREGIIPYFSTDNNLGSGQEEFIQASLVENSATDNLDFWRISMDGKVSLIRGFHEDEFTKLPNGLSKGEKWFDPWLHVRDITELVRHSRALSEELGNITQICFRIEWKGLKGRKMATSNPERYYSGGECKSDQRVVSECFSITEIIGNLPNVVNLLYSPVHRMFNSSFDVTSEWIARILPNFIVAGL